MPLQLSRFSYTLETWAKLSEARPCAPEDEIAGLRGERPREPGAWKSVGVEEEHEIAASGAQPLVERPRLSGPTQGQRQAGQHGRAVLLADRGGAVGGLVVYDDDLGEVRLAGEPREASGEAPFFISSRYNRADRALGIRARRRERRAPAASSREPAHQHERRGELAGAKDHHAAWARGG
jgi:hypothetical protein